MEPEEETVTPFTREAILNALDAYIKSHCSFLTAPEAAFDLILEHLPQISEFSPDALALVKSRIYIGMSAIVRHGFGGDIVVKTFNPARRRAQLEKVVAQALYGVTYHLVDFEPTQYSNWRPSPTPAYVGLMIIDMIKYQIVNTLLQSLDMFDPPKKSKKKKS